LKSGGKVKYPLSGLMVCERCGANYVIANARSYACGGHRDGRACTNDTRVRRTVVEKKILGPIHDELLAPERVARMAIEMQQGYSEHLRQTEARAEKMPRELEELTARIARFRERLRQGDPDMTADELQAAIDRAESKRRELSGPAARGQGDRQGIRHDPACG
jgi:hypothetical protein